jgi:O-acetyl-ADP-ribose deacetylase (regulator of RNase III)/NAD-dependent SIR2 family protein deacetylase
MTNMTTEVLKAALMSVLRDGGFDPSSVQYKVETEASYRDVLGDLLIASNSRWRDETLALIDRVWKAESDSRTTVSIEHLPTFITAHGTNISLWKGDITALKGNTLAIVNAANDQGLGCFQAGHKCIDNVIHRQAGPRLRMECQKVMKDRGRPLAAGTTPIVTFGYCLPSSHVIHVTGPQVTKGNDPTHSDREKLWQAYQLALESASRTQGVRTIAIPCISTGIFGFPQEEAARIALASVNSWLHMHPSALETVIFNVFTDRDLSLYEKYMHITFETPTTSVFPVPVDSMRKRTIDLAKQWIDDADAVLICAGAGMSVKDGEMVYTNSDDFAQHYPWFTKWGYKTAYECMGLMGDKSVPSTAKWAFQVKHMDNMRWTFAPSEGYEQLLRLVGNKDYFVLTSNVDACFERSGFDRKRIYTPQGEWTWLQCKNACQPDSVWDSRPYLDSLLPSLSENGFVPQELIPKCPRCGSDMFGNVRGGDWFLHRKYEEQNDALQKWMERKVDDGSKVVIIEVGAGFNTPTVTRLPVESFARELGGRATFVRINPTEAAVPEDLNGIALEEGWKVLRDIGRSGGTDNRSIKEEELSVKQALAESELLAPDHITMRYRRYFGHMDWRHFLNQLRDD